MDEGKLTHLRGLSVAGSCQPLATSSDHFLAAVTGSYGSVSTSRDRQKSAISGHRWSFRNLEQFMVPIRKSLMLCRFR